MSMASTQWMGLRARLFTRHLDSARRRRRDGAMFGEILDDLRTDEVVLDLGAGTGYLSLAVAGQLVQGRVIALDLSEPMLTKLRRRAEKAKVVSRIEPRLADAAATGLPDGSVDRVLSSMLLHEVADPSALLREVARVLRPGGKVVLKDFRRGVVGWFVKLMHLWRSCGPLSPEELDGHMQAAGLRQVKVVPQGPLLMATGVR